MLNNIAPIVIVHKGLPGENAANFVRGAYSSVGVLRLFFTIKSPVWCSLEPVSRRQTSHERESERYGAYAREDANSAITHSIATPLLLMTP